ncbi:MAG: hypothetical protein KAW09_04115 [Thermoplasmata archaeon]|nr:hypothetical protein [Thermoplasmata archaeon]
MFVGMAPNDGRDDEGTYKVETIRLRDFERQMQVKYWKWSEGPRRGSEWEFADIFDGVLGSLSMTKRDIYFTNAVKCALSKHNRRNGEGLTHCWKYLEEEIMAVKPKLIVSFGSYAASALQCIFKRKEEVLPLPVMGDLHGNRMDIGNESPVILSLLHWGRKQFRERNMRRVHKDRGKAFEESAELRMKEAAKMAGLLHRR